MKVKATVKAMDLSALSEEAVVNLFAPRIMNALRERIGPHYVAVARNRTPVSAERNFNPTSAFRRLVLKPLGSFSRQSPDYDRFLFLHSFDTARERARNVNTLTDAKFFKIGAEPGRPGARLRRELGDRSPDLIEAQRGTIKGAFAHRPGTLKNSIRIDSVRREGNRVVLTVRAHAPYAYVVHEGFSHRGGQKKGGKRTHIKGQPFLRSPIANVQARLAEPSTYSG